MRPDVLLVSIGGTAGLRASDDALAGALRRAGATVAVARVAPRPRAADVRADRPRLGGPGAAGRAGRACAPPGRGRSSTARRRRRCCGPSPARSASTRPRPATGPGRHGIWQRPVERRRLAAAPLLVPLTARRARGGAAGRHAGDRGPDPRRAVRTARRGARPRGDHLRREPRQEGPGPRARRVARRRGAATRRSSSPGVAGRDEPGVRYAGMLAPDAYRALLRRARVFATAPRREDYGIAQLEALADGCALVTNAAPGPYAALPLARALDPRLAGDDLARGAARGAGRPGARLRGARRRRCSRRSRRRPSTASSPSACCPRCSR